MNTAQDRHESTPLRFIVGARVSTEEQSRNGVSLAHQLDAGREKVADLGGIVAGYCVEGGVSGALYESRTDLQDALAQIEHGEADGFVWYDLSRMSRDIEYIAAIQKRIVAAGAQLHFCTTEYADSADGAFHRGIDSVMYQHQRLKTRELNVANRRKAAAQGRQPQRSRPPYGYRIITNHDVIRGTHAREELGKYEIVPAEAEIVLEIFTRYAANDSLRDICRVLQARGVPTPKGRRGGINYAPDGEPLAAPPIQEWQPATIRTIIRNECHKGKATFGKQRCVHDESRRRAGLKTTVVRKPVDPSRWVVIECPAIVEEGLWEAANSRMSEAKVTSAGWPERKHMLTSLLRCPNCRRTLKVQHVGRRNGTQTYYCCRRASPSFSANQVVCTPTRYPETVLEQRVIEAVDQIVNAPDLLEDAFHRYQKSAKHRYSDETLSALQRELADLEKQVQSAVSAQVQAISKGIDPSAYEKILADTSQRRQSLRSEIAAFARARDRMSQSDNDASKKSRYISALAGDVKYALSSDTVLAAEKQAMLARIIDTIYPTPDGVRISFRPGVFSVAQQRWIWSDGKWDITDAPNEGLF